MEKVKVIEALTNDRERFTTWKGVSFPSGSSYRNEHLIPGEFNLERGSRLVILKWGSAWRVWIETLHGEEWKRSEEIGVPEKRHSVGGGKASIFKNFSDQELDFFGDRKIVTFLYE